MAATLVLIGGGELTDATFIFVLLQFNAAIGSYQEWRAEVAALSGRLQRSSPTVLLHCLSGA